MLGDEYHLGWALYAFGARPTVVESIMLDGEIDGSIYGTIYPTVYGSKNGALEIRG